jgi:hypothetical protein
VRSLRLALARPFSRVGLIVASALVAVGVPAAQALFADSATVGGNSFTTGSWATAIVYHLHNNPTPPTGNTNMQASLPIDVTTPGAVTLYNYDQDRDAFPGRLVLKGASGAGESDLTKYQNWRSAQLASPLTIDGMVTLDFWSAIKDFTPNKRGSVTAYLRDFNPASSTYTEIANATLTVSNWQGGSGSWVSRSLSVSVTDYVLSAGSQLELKLIVTGSSDENMWFAYDTVAYPSSLTLD